MISTLKILAVAALWYKRIIFCETGKICELLSKFRN